MHVGRLRVVALRTRDRLGLSLRGLTAVVAGGGVLLVSLAVFGAVAGDVIRHDGVVGRDVSVLQFFTVHRTAPLVDISRGAADIGSVVGLAVIAVVVGAWFWHRRLGPAVALAPVAALAAGGACVVVMKSIINRPRPAVPLHLVSVTDASFPSGHATDSAAVFITVALLVAVFVVRRPLARTLTVASGVVATGVIGLSRLELGVHWPTDVVAGWALGVSTALVVTATVWLLTPAPNGVDGVGRRVDRAAAGAGALPVGDCGDVGTVRAA